MKMLKRFRNSFIFRYGLMNKPSEWASVIGEAMLTKGQIEDVSSTNQPIIYECEGGMSSVEVRDTHSGIVVTLTRRSGETCVYDHKMINDNDQNHLSRMYFAATRKIIKRVDKAKHSPRFSPEQFR